MNVRDGYKLTTVGDRDYHQAVALLRERFKCFWTNKSINVLFLKPEEGCKMKEAKEFNPSQVVNTSSVRIFCDMLFMDNIGVLQNRVEMLRLQYGIQLENNRTENIMDDIPYRDYLPARSCGL